MKRLRELVREPALVIDLVETLVVLVVAFGIGLSGDQQTYTRPPWSRCSAWPRD